MTTELVALLVISVFLLLGFAGSDVGPIKTFKDATPRLAARIERDVSVGRNFSGQSSKEWLEPQ